MSQTKTPVVIKTVKAALDKRTVYLKGFNLLDTDLDELWAFFNKYEGLRDVKKRYFYKEITSDTEEGEEGENGADKTASDTLLDRIFKGSIFVEFKTAGQAQKVLEEKDLVYRGTTISEKMLHSNYMKKKEEEEKERVALREENRSTTDVVEEKKVKQEDSRGSTRLEGHMVKGALLKVKNIPCGFGKVHFKKKWYEATNIEEFKIVFADFKKGDTEGVLRLEKEGSAAEALKLLPEGKLPMGEDKIVDVTGVSAAYETYYWENIKKDHTGRKRTFVGRGSRGGRGGRGGYKRRKY